jgi:hypothetical protein
MPTAAGVEVGSGRGGAWAEAVATVRANPSKGAHSLTSA